MKKQFLLISVIGLTMGCLGFALAKPFFKSYAEEEITEEEEQEQRPSFSGVKENHTIVTGESWNVLEGVSAYDAQDGNLTSSIRVVVDGNKMEITDGVLTPSASGDYYVVYRVNDSDGYAGIAVTELHVDKAQPRLFHQYEFFDNFEWNAINATFKNKENGLKVFTNGAAIVSKSLGTLDPGDYEATISLLSESNLTINASVDEVSQDIVLTANELKEEVVAFTLSGDVASSPILSLAYTGEASFAIKELNLICRADSQTIKETEFNPDDYTFAPGGQTVATKISGEGYVGAEVTHFSNAAYHFKMGRKTTATIENGTTYHIKVAFYSLYQQKLEIKCYRRASDDGNYAMLSDSFNTLNDDIAIYEKDFTPNNANISSIEGAYFDFFMGEKPYSWTANEEEGKTQILKLVGFELTVPHPSGIFEQFDEHYDAFSPKCISYYSPSEVDAETPANSRGGTLAVDEGKLIYTVENLKARDIFNRVELKGLKLTDKASYNVNWTLKFNYREENTGKLYYKAYIATTSGDIRVFSGARYNMVPGEEVNFSYDFDYTLDGENACLMCFQFGDDASNKQLKADIEISNVNILKY